MKAGTAAKKPIPIHWLEWDGSMKSLSEWVGSFGVKPEDKFVCEKIDMESDYVDRLHVKTLEGTSYEVPIGYIIIRGIRGEYYPCDPNIFTESYDILKETISNQHETVL